ncbi:MAG: hypothetical protein IK121_06005 [Lachnospiraceae bacterium]|nr:hypothetical protein [Lachnospiraceae bacterium]MBR5356455.1 hypothetical protein [Lachnospiraceae bacterium]
MTNEERAFLSRINKYAETKLADIEPQKTLVSVQLEALKPIMQEIADETGMKIEEVFIKYMDLQSEAVVETEKKLQDDMKALDEASK